MIDEAAIAEFRRVSKIHEDWLVYAVVGPSLLTKGELDAVYLYGLPVDYPLDLTTTSYLLGKKAAHLQDLEYKSLTFTDLDDFSTLTDLEKASISDLRITAASEFRKIARYVSDTLEQRLRACVSKGFETSVISGVTFEEAVYSHARVITEEVFSKAFTLFKNMYHLAALDLVHISKSRATVNSIVQAEGIYTEGLQSQVVVTEGDSVTPLTIGDLLTKSLSGSSLCYVPPGSSYISGKIVVVDPEQFEEALVKARSGVSGGISATVKPAGPPKTTSIKSPGSVAGVAAPGNTAGPGRGANQPNAPKKGVEYDDWVGPGQPKPDGEGWEQSTTGGWRHIKGASGGVKPAMPDSEELMQKQRDAIAFGKQPHTDTEVLGHLREGTFVSIKKLGTNESGIHTAFRVTTESGGRGLMKPTEYQTAETHGNYAGTGYGSVPRNNSHGHEVAAYKVFTMLGLDTVPPTTSRAFDGATHSIQAWAEDHVPTEVHMMDKMGDEKNHTIALLNLVPEDRREDVTKQVMGMITMDAVINNNDRHRDNVIIHKDNTGIKAIDHGESFGTGLKGQRNDFHKDLHRAGKKVVIPEQLKTSLRNKTLGDFKRALGGHIQDWQIGQTYLRAQYVLHLQDTEGHLDYHKFLPTIDGFHGKDETPTWTLNTAGERVLDHGWRTNGSHRDMAEFERRKEEKLLPNDLFQSFAKKFINDHKNNPESRYHAVANELDTLGVFMPSTAMSDPKAFRREGKHVSYAETISPRNPPVQVGSGRNLGTDKYVDPKAATQVDDLKPVEEAATIRERRAGQRRGGEDASPKTIRQRDRRRGGRRASD